MSEEKQSEAIWTRFNKGEISHEQVQLELDKIWGSRDVRYGLLTQLHEDINEMVFQQVPWDRRTLNRIEEKFNDVSHNLDWIAYFDGHTVPKLTDVIKRNITLHLDRTELWVNWLLYLDHILSFYLYNTKETVFNATFQEVADYYDFLSQHISLCQMWEKVPKPFDTNPLDRYQTHRVEEERLDAMVKAEREAIRARKPCPKCGANNRDGVMRIISKNKLRWLCNKCGKSYNKH